MPIPSPLWPQWLAAFKVSLLALLITMSTKWNISIMEAACGHQTWIDLLRISNKLLGIILGTLATSFMGASITIYICGFFCVVNSLCLICGNMGAVVYIYLICSEIVLGMFICASPIYIGEIASPTIRGKLVSLVIQGAVTGNFLSNITENMFGPLITGIVILIISMIFLVTFLFFPPTPYYLMSCKKTHQALESIKWYNRETDGCNEIECLVTFFQTYPIIPSAQTLSITFASINRRTLLLCFIITAFYNLGGMLAILNRMEELLNCAQIKNPHETIVMMQTIVIIVSWMLFLTSDMFERNCTMLIGSSTLSITVFCCGVGYHFIELGYSQRDTQWMILISTIVYQVAINIVYLPVSFMMMSELFPPNLKNIAICLCNTVLSISSFIADKYFDLLISYLTFKVIFYLFAVVTVITGTLYTIFIPKTKQKSLEEIQAMLNCQEPTMEVIELRHDNLIDISNN